MDELATCTICGDTFGPLSGHDLGVEGKVCRSCYVEEFATRTVDAIERERRRRRDRARILRWVLAALVLFWSGVVAVGVWGLFR